MHRNHTLHLPVLHQHPHLQQDEAEQPLLCQEQVTDYQKGRKSCNNSDCYR